MYLQNKQISISNVSKNQVGRIIALYIGVFGLGKIFFCSFYEMFFIGDLGGFFLARGFLWTLMGVLCFFLHRPSVHDEEKMSLFRATEHKFDGQTEGILGIGKSSDVTNNGEIRKTDILKSPYFHMTYWRSITIFSCFCTCMNSLTAVGESARLENPLVLVFLLSITMVASRLLVYILYDHFPSDSCGFLCLYSSYFCFVVAMIMGLTWFNETNVFLMAFLVGASVSGGNTLPLTLLAAHFGRTNYYALTGGYFIFYVPTLIIFQMFVGQFYGTEIISGSTDNPACFRSQCCLWIFVMLLCATAVVYLIQLFNHLCIHNVAFTSHSAE